MGFKPRVMSDLYPAAKAAGNKYGINQAALNQELKTPNLW